MRKIHLLTITLLSVGLLGCGNVSTENLQKLQTSYKEATAALANNQNSNFTLNGSVSNLPNNTSSNGINDTTNNTSISIEAYGQNGSYYQSIPIKGQTGSNTFSLTLPTKLKFYLFVKYHRTSGAAHTIKPIRWKHFNSSGTVFFGESTKTIHLGIINGDNNEFIIHHQDSDDDKAGKTNGKIKHKFYNYHLSSTSNLRTSSSTLNCCDHDNDGLHNIYDSDYHNSSHHNSKNDSDNDGVPDVVDYHPTNNSTGTVNPIYSDLDKDHDGYLDGDSDKDGFYDDDHDRDGYHDYSDYNKDGYHDHEEDKYEHSNKRKKSSSTHYQREIKGTITQKNGTFLTVNRIKIDTSNAYFEHTRLSYLRVGSRIEAKGTFYPQKNTLIASKVERD